MLKHFEPPIFKGADGPSLQTASSINATFAFQKRSGPAVPVTLPPPPPNASASSGAGKGSQGAAGSKRGRSPEASGRQAGTRGAR